MSEKIQIVFVTALRRTRLSPWLGRAVTAGILAMMILVALVASVGGHAITFYLFGSGLPMSLVLGVALTGIAIVTGYQGYEKIFVRHHIAELLSSLPPFCSVSGDSFR